MPNERTKSESLLRKFRDLDLSRGEIEDIFYLNKHELNIKLQAFVNQASGISNLSYDVGKILEKETSK